MTQDFLTKLTLTNLLYMKDNIEKVISEKDPNEVFATIKKLDEQLKNVKNNKDYDLIKKNIDFLNELFC